jgi:hypothetical protein
MSLNIPMYEIVAGLDLSAATMKKNPTGTRGEVEKREGPSHIQSFKFTTTPDLENVRSSPSRWTAERKVHL